MAEEKLLRDHLIEAQILSASFSHFTHEITKSGDAHRALEFLQRCQRAIDSGYHVEFQRKPPCQQRRVRQGGAR